MSARPLVAKSAVGERWGTSSALFSPDRQHRYALTRRWDPTLPWCAFVMLNPSLADHERLDRTVTRCLGFASDWGCGGLLVLNAYGLRSTDPAALRTHPDPVGSDNDDVIYDTLQATQPSRMVVAWGMHVNDGHPHREAALARLLDGRMSALRVTAAGHPGHPLYVPADTVPAPWRAA